MTASNTKQAQLVSVGEKHNNKNPYPACLDKNGLNN